jgi:hypothetical protein
MAGLLLSLTFLDVAKGIEGPTFKNLLSIRLLGPVIRVASRLGRDDVVAVRNEAGNWVVSDEAMSYPDLTIFFLPSTLEIPTDQEYGEEMPSLLRGSDR